MLARGRHLLSSRLPYLGRTHTAEQRTYQLLSTDDPAHHHTPPGRLAQTLVTIRGRTCHVVHWGFGLAQAELYVADTTDATP
jgi:hypothetical protein